MAFRYITSLGHPFVKRWIKLRDNPKFRLEQQRVLIVGKMMIRDVALHMPILSWMGETSLEIPAQEMFIGSAAVIRKVIGMNTDDLAVAEVALPVNASLKNASSIVVLDRLSDPGNVGNIIRTALALGIEGVFLTPGTVDPFNDKVVRASSAACLLIPLCKGSCDDLLSLIRNNSMSVYATDVAGKKLSEITFKKPLALILGNEIKGVSPLLKACGERVAIPMKDMESLNVGSAAAIFIYQIQQGALF
jgi:RNA methyltransferase, TrmH family